MSVFLRVLFVAGYIFTACAEAESLQSGISPNGGGLFGDKLFLYAKAKWLAHMYNIPFIYNSFIYSNELALHDVEMRQRNMINKFEKKEVVPSLGNAFSFRNDETLYSVELESADPQWGKFNQAIEDHQYFLKDIDTSNAPDIVRIDVTKDASCKNSQYHAIPEEFYFNHLYYAVREDQFFLSELRRLIVPLSKINLIPLPANKITVAVHIRMGGKFELFKHIFPNEISTRVPQQSYYIEQIIKLSEMVGDKPMFIYIFTNHKKPHVLLQKIKRAVKKKNIEFMARRSSSSTSTFDIFQDLFSMARFDCLIRPNSSFSQMAQLLGDHKVIIYPGGGFWDKSKLTIHKIGLIVNDKNLFSDTL